MKISELYIFRLVVLRVVELSVIFVTASFSSLLAQDVNKRSYKLNEITVRANRPLVDIGVQKTVFDSLALKENIALSMSDVLTFNSSVFVKNYGRATLSTISFRGTSPSHTKVSWNGMQINNPMLGTTDFSTIPSYFIDKAALFHGSSSINETGGGLGGLVKLSTEPEVAKGFQTQYTQGVGSFNTFDEFGKIAYSNEHWSFSTKAAYSASPNDYKYTNHDKRLYRDEADTEGFHPKEKNKSGSFKDLNLLQEIFYNNKKGDKIGVNVWYFGSNRELPLLTTDYSDETKFENRQREHTLRGVVTFSHNRSNWHLDLKGGYVHSRLAYDYKREVGNKIMATMTRSRNKINTFFGSAEGSYTLNKHWYFTGQTALHQQNVRCEDRNIVLQDNDRAIVGYDKRRPEWSSSVSAKYQPFERLGASIVLREELYGVAWTPLIPAFFADYLLEKEWNVMLKGSISKNYRYPSLNDLYFLPGGNPKLKSESGFTYDMGLSFNRVGRGRYSFGGKLTWFDSKIDDWILWLPTTKGFFSPRNVKKVHSYGVETGLDLSWRFNKEWLFEGSGTYSWTPSVNKGEKLSEGDRSVGRQLPYVPRHSASVTGRLTWRTWGVLYKWCYYSERFTMSSNEYTLSGHLPPYYMNNVTFEKSFDFSFADLSIKLSINNLFNEDYISVLSRPMPGRNFEIFINIII